MTTILALDPAWTPTEPSGVALLKETAGSWACIGLAPSYDQFVALGHGTPVNWGTRPQRRRVPFVPVADLLKTAVYLGGSAVDLVTIDMPVSTDPITGRRHCDNEMSSHFGSRGCSAHTPNSVRPGPISTRLQRDFAHAGYPLATQSTPPGTRNVLMEVYPHPALLALLNERYRVRYKIARTTRYWPGLSLIDRRKRIVQAWRDINSVLTHTITGAIFPIPSVSAGSRLFNADLKRYEDALDALVCGWVGIEYLARRCVPYGDPTAAIWTPPISLLGGGGPSR